MLHRISHAVNPVDKGSAADHTRLAQAVDCGWGVQDHEIETELTLLHWVLQQSVSQKFSRCQ
jgi:hypothetical protein